MVSSKKLTDWKTSVKSALISTKEVSLILLGLVFAMGLFVNFFSSSFITGLFNGNSLFDSILGGVIGSVMAGSPIESYIIGGELQKKGVEIAAISSLIIAWVTVGFLQIPFESRFLGKKFTILRNIMGLILAIIFGVLISFFGGVLF